MKNDPQYLSITKLCQLYNTVLSQTCGTVYFEGEISSITRGARDHHYLKIKDQSSVISAIIWGSYAVTLKFKMEVGQKVLCQGSPQIYAARGDLSTVISSIKLSGQGDLQQKFLELQEKLSKEGLFEPSRKRALPFLPQAIGIITSASGAVIHDMSVKFAERHPNVKIYLYDARVQGEGAYQDLIAGLNYFNQQSGVDLIILARGGGSLEDLWNFNEEALVRAIFASRLPVISGVGHEPDITLADLVADVRAPTPTAAAEMAVPKIADLKLNIDRNLQRLQRVERWFFNYQQRFDLLSERFINSQTLYFEQQQQALQHLQRVLKLIEPKNLIATKAQSLQNQMKSLRNAYAQVVQAATYRLQQTANLQEVAARSLLQRKQFLSEKHKHLAAINPTSILARGYSLVKKENIFIRSAQEVKPKDQLEVQFAEGKINVIVE